MTVTDRLLAGHPADLAKCIRTDLGCADVCEATGRVLYRHTGYHAETHEHCRICAEAGRRCEQACRDLIAAPG